MEYESIKFETEDSIAIITLNRPKAMNAIGESLIKDFNNVVPKIESDDNIRAVIVTGGKDIFAAGADIKEMVDAGLCSTIVGIQAGAERIRKKVFRRMLPTGRLMKFAETVKDLKLDYSYHLINFNPFETEQDMDETLELLYKLPYSSMFVFKLVPFTGTPIFRMIKDSNVEPLPDKIHKWYGFLYTMAVKGPVFRGECKVIHKSKLFRSSLFVFPILFFPSFLMLHFKKLLRKIVFGSYTLMPIPVKARKNE